jgi:osmotically-inducible protein OsmY
MRLTPVRFAAFGATLMTLPLLQGCVLFAAGAGGSAAYTASQERTIGNAIDDTTITTKINAGLVATSATLFTAVDVNCVNGRVMLTGVVSTPEQREQAGQVARDVRGVREVINEIQIGGGGFIRSADDALVSSKLRTKLIGDKEVASRNYDISTVNGVIYVFGIARNQAELDRVLNYARSISGVQRVVNHAVLAEERGRM